MPILKCSSCGAPLPETLKCEYCGGLDEKYKTPQLKPKSPRSASDLLMDFERKKRYQQRRAEIEAYSKEIREIMQDGKFYLAKDIAYEMDMSIQKVCALLRQLNVERKKGHNGCIKYRLIA